MERQVAFARPTIDQAEKQAVAAVLDGHILVHGPKSEQFERDFCGYVNGGFAVSVSSCTAALHLAYFDLGITSGDEVIVPAQTHIATAHAVEYCGGRAVFVDAEPRTGNINIDAIEEKITSRTKAISLVHYLGLPVDMAKINEIAQKHGLFVLEDCALAMGSYYDGVHCGLLGDAGCFSFYPVKHITTAEGGMFLTKNAELAERIKRKKAFGLDRTVFERKVPGQYDTIALGYNYRLNELQCAMGIEQLKKLDGMLEKRRANYDKLYNWLSEIDEVELLWPGDEKFKSSRYCMLAVLKYDNTDTRFDIVKGLGSRGVGTSIYYPGPVPAMSYYKDKYGYEAGDYPVASRISNCGIALPVGPHLDTEDMDYIVKSLKESICEVK
jgi:dTDP-4-amino-4,6-dideoxygalactose transaminase